METVLAEEAGEGRRRWNVGIGQSWNAVLHFLAVSFGGSVRLHVS